MSNGHDVIVDVRDVQMVYNAKNRDESTHVHALRGLTVQVYETSFLPLWGLLGRGRARFQHDWCLQSPTGGEVLIEGVNLASLNTQQQAAVRCFELGYISRPTISCR